MSRSTARALHAIVRALTAGMNPSRRAQTQSRLMARLDAEGVHTIETRHGPLITLPLRGPHLAAAAVGFDEEEPELLAWIDGFSAGETLWDIGAAGGLFAMYAAHRGIAVTAFEPKATSFGVLVEHLVLNGLSEQVMPLCVALSDVTGLTHLTLYSMDPGSGRNAVGGAVNQFGETSDPALKQGIAAWRIDDLRKALTMPAPDHIKIDVDGIEGLILRGAPETLPLVKSVLVEVEGDNAAKAASRIDPPLAVAGLFEDLAMRDQGSGRNRLYRRRQA
jgi:FkbM family methyltransferase